MQPRNEEAEFLAGAQLHLDPDDGIDCGACVPACPVSAIYLARTCRSEPERGMKFAAINAEWSASEDYRMAGCFRFAGELSRR